ncbi:MAG: PIG-L deacetylase family protein [Minisyncoccales bacterium]
MKILIIAPHPDDEVLGCGGTIKKCSQRGDEIILCIVTKAYLPDWTQDFIDGRPREIEKSNAILGISGTRFLNFPSVMLDTIPQKELNASISKVINGVKPEIIYVPNGGDLNKDHRLIFEASLVAARPGENRIKKILCYECPSETEWGQPIKPFVPNVYSDITGFLNEKLEAMKAYKSELKNYPHPRSLETIEALAKKRGSEAGFEAAESFALIREIL